MSLAMCALACRTWLTHCQRLLYRDVTIKENNQLDMFTKTMDMSPRLQCHIHILRIDGTSQPPRSRDPWITTGLISLLSGRLSMVHTLELIKVRQCPEDDSCESFANLPRQGSIAILSLVSCMMPATEFTHLIGAFQQLRALFLYDFINASGSNPYHQISKNISPLFSCHHLARITLCTREIPAYDAEGDNSLCQWVLNRKTKTSFEELYIGTIKSDICKWSNFVKGLGPSLWHLEIANLHPNPSDTLGKLLSNIQLASSDT